MKPRSCDTSRAGCVPTFPELPPLHLFPLFALLRGPWRQAEALSWVTGKSSHPARSGFLFCGPWDLCLLSTIHPSLSLLSQDRSRNPARRRWLLRASGWHKIFHPRQVCDTQLH